jgi:hypothetical protein
MTDPTRNPDTRDDMSAGPGGGAKPGTPHWLKVSLIVAAVVVLLAIVLALTGVLGQHGPEQFGPGQHGA